MENEFRMDGIIQTILELLEAKKYSKARDEIIKNEWIIWENIQRYKWLWEMNPEQLWETTMDPLRRKMYRVTIEDAKKADEIFKILMWDEVAPRRRFIQSRAKSVKNLDV